MRALVVEDEKSLAQALAELLKKDNFVVDIAYDGVDGLDYLLSGLYDVALLDIMLPKMNGFDVLKNARKEKISTPVLVLTARDQITDKIEGLNLGADDYLTKPFDKEELIARVHALTRRKGEISEDVIKFGDIGLNIKNCKMICGDNSVELGRKEFLLLEFLLKNSTQILTKDDIIDKVWGLEGDAEYNNVEVYISFLRKKLALLTQKVNIKTIRGVGYIMEKVDQ